MACALIFQGLLPTFCPLKSRSQPGLRAKSRQKVPKQPIQMNPAKKRRPLFAEGKNKGN